MKHHLLSAGMITGALLLATSVQAQQSGGGASPGTTSPSSSQSERGRTSGSSDTMEGRPKAMTQGKLRETLQQSGFTDIRILDAAYLVHAKTRDGDVVLMTINPPTMASASSGTSTTMGTASGSDDNARQPGRDTGAGSGSGSMPKTR